MSGLRFEFDDDALDRLAASIADRIGQRRGPEPWVGVAEAAEHLNCKPQRIYALVHARSGIPYRKDGTRLLFRLSELDAWLEDQAA